MASCTPAALRKHIRGGTLDSVYVLLGGDEAEKAALVDAMCATVDEGLRAFNVERIYGQERAASLAQVLEAVRTVPVMTERRIVVVRQADRLLSPREEASEAESRDHEAFLDYVAAPLAGSCLLLLAGQLDERRREVKALLQRATVVPCDGVAEEDRAARWVVEQARERGARVTPEAVASLVQRAGRDPERLRGALDRLLLYVGDRKQVSREDVEAVTRDASGPDGPWGVTNAIERGAGAEALRELGLQLEAGTSPYLILGQLGWCARARLTGVRAVAGVEAVFRTDLALKSSGGEPRLLLERLVVELCGTGGRGPDLPQPGSAAARMPTRAAGRADR